MVGPEHDPARPDTSRLSASEILAQEHVELVRHYASSIVKYSGEAIIGKTLDGAIVSWNPGAERIYGHEVLGKPYARIVPPERLEELAGIQASVRNGRRVENLETFHVRKDGRRIEVSVTVAPVKNEAGKIVGASAVARDITAARARAEQVNRQRAALLELARTPGADLDSSLRRITEVAARTLSVERVSVWLLGPDRAELVCRDLFRLGAGVHETAPPLRSADFPRYFEALEKSTVLAAADAPADPRTLEFAEPYLRPLGITSMMDVPLRLHGRLVGVLCHEHTGPPRSWSVEDEDFAQAAAALVCLGLETSERLRADKALQKANAELEGRVRELSQRTREMTSLAHLGELLQTCQEMDEAYDVIGRMAPQLFPAESGAVYMLDAAHTVAEARASWGDPRLLAEGGAFARDHCWALRLGHTHLMQPESSAPLCKHLPRPGPPAAACALLASQGETLGVLHVAAPAGAGELLESRRHLAATVAEQIGLALANLRLRATLRAQSIRDPLTSLYNRRYLEEALDREIHRAVRNKSSLGLLMADIDHFKRFNDSYGHVAGDALLRELAAFLERSTRREDVACRYGGEEFTIILGQSTAEGAVRRAEALREGAGEIEVVHQGRSLGRVTLSLGVAVFPDHGRSPAELLQAADQALYRSKDAGRNRVTLAS
jgi:diguanylate cyclase (GGDEF)-like protein/PAS domain S-box-containing protein